MFLIFADLRVFFLKLLPPSHFRRPDNLILIFPPINHLLILKAQTVLFHTFSFPQDSLSTYPPFWLAYSPFCPFQPLTPIFSHPQPTAPRKPLLSIHITSLYFTLLSCEILPSPSLPPSKIPFFKNHMQGLHCSQIFPYCQHSDFSHAEPSFPGRTGTIFWSEPFPFSLSYFIRKVIFPFI